MNKQKSGPEKTVLIIATGFLGVYLVTKWNWAIAVSFLTGLAGVLSHHVSRKIDFLWSKLSWLLGLIVPNIVLGAVFYLLLFPIALLSRRFGGSAHLMLENRLSSTYTDVKKEFGKNSFEKPW